LGYGDVGNVSQDRKNQIMAEAGLKKVKGHKKGKAGSGVSRQMQDETKKFVDTKQKIEAREAKQKKCDTYHANRHNVGKVCPTCGKKVVEQ
jgi:DNA repair exonuclease SbcCD ATPase subunit